MDILESLVGVIVALDPVWWGNSKAGAVVPQATNVTTTRTFVTMVRNRQLPRLLDIRA